MQSRLVVACPYHRDSSSLIVMFTHSTATCPRMPSSSPVLLRSKRPLHRLNQIGARRSNTAQPLASQDSHNNDCNDATRSTIHENICAATTPCLSSIRHDKSERRGQQTREISRRCQRRQKDKVKDKISDESNNNGDESTPNSNDVGACHKRNNRWRIRKQTF